MIVVRIFEGLGNQLFQYAMGRAVAERHGVELRLDLDWYGGDQGGRARRSARRACRLLDAFHCHARPATRRDLAYHRAERTRLGRAASKAWRLGSSCLGRQVFERGRHYQAAYLDDAGPDAYLDGFWQTERYFAPVADLLRDEFRPRPTPGVDRRPPAGSTAWRAEDGGPLVGVHVRRGDLVPVVVDGGVHRNHGPPTSAAFVRAAMRLYPARQPVRRRHRPRPTAPWCRAAPRRRRRRLLPRPHRPGRLRHAPARATTT